MAVIHAKAGRYCQASILLRNSDGSNYVVAANDVIRVKVGHPGETPKLDLSSAAASPNGSTLSKSNPAILTLQPEDLETTDLTPGTWDVEVLVNAQGTGGKPVSADVSLFVLEDTQLGTGIATPA